MLFYWTYNCDIAVLYCDKTFVAGKKSGTKLAFDFAIKKGIKIINLKG